MKAKWPGIFLLRFLGALMLFAVLIPVMPGSEMDALEADGDGLTILATGTMEEARQAMQEEPLNKPGLRTCELRKRELGEGGMDISLRSSVSRYCFDAVRPA